MSALAYQVNSLCSYYWTVNAFQSTSGNITALASGINILKAAGMPNVLAGFNQQY